MTGTMTPWVAALGWSLAALFFAIDAHTTAGVVVCSVGVVVNIIGLSTAWGSARAAKRAEGTR